VTYTPDTGFSGTDSFTYTVDDNEGATSNRATVTVTVVSPSIEGACCMPDGSCTEGSEKDCNTAGGTYQGDGTDCASANCALPTGVIEGTVTDADSKDPIRGAEIQIEEECCCLPPNTISDQDGHFLMECIPRKYHLTAKASDYIEATEEVDVKHNEKADVLFELEPVQAITPIAVDDQAITQEDTPIIINVVSNDIADGAIDAATVEIVSDPSSGLAVPNGDGTVTYTPELGFCGEDSFSYRVYDNEGLASNEATVTVMVDCSNMPALIQGTVSDADSKDPIQGAEIQVEEECCCSPPNTISDQDGHFLMECIPRKYNLTAKASGYIETTEEVEVMPAAIAPVRFELIQERTSWPIVLTVTDLSGNLIQDFTITTEGGCSAAHSGEEEEFEIRCLPGAHLVTVEASGYKPKSNCVVVRPPGGDLFFKLVPNGDDGDGDGVPDEEEQGPDGNTTGYSGNIEDEPRPDAGQNDVASLHTHDGASYVTMESHGSTFLTSCEAHDNPDCGETPAGVEFPYGFFTFVINNVDSGGPSALTLYLPEDALPDTYYRYGPTPDNELAHWYEFLYDGQTGAEIDENLIILHFIDGKRGDDDLDKNGIVVDQGGPAFGHTRVHSDEDVGGAWCFITTASYGYVSGPEALALMLFFAKIIAATLIFEKRTASPLN